MERKTYLIPDITIVRFENNDIITESIGEDSGGDEPP